MRQLICLICSFSAILVLATPASLPATEISAPRLLPASVVLYAETTSVGDLLGGLLDHPQRHKLKALPQYQEWLESPERRQLLLGVQFMEAQLGVPWRDAIEQLGDGGTYFAFDGASRGIAILVKSADEAFLNKTEERLLNLARADAAGRGDPAPFKSSEYRGRKPFARTKSGSPLSGSGWF